MSGHQPWFYHHPELSLAIGPLLKFPTEMQSMIADGVCTIAERDLKAKELLENLRSLGSDKIVEFYKAHEENKAYSHNPSLFKALNYLLILPEPGRITIAGHISMIIDNVVHYLAHCKNIRHSPHFDELRNIVQFYVDLGAEKLERLLFNLQERGSRLRQTLNTSSIQLIEEDLEKSLLIIEDKNLVTPSHLNQDDLGKSPLPKSSSSKAPQGKSTQLHMKPVEHPSAHSSIEASNATEEDDDLTNRSLLESDEGIKIKEESL